MTIESSSIPISVRGRYFWRGDERASLISLKYACMDVLIMNKFFIRGVVYQTSGDWQQGIVNDPISDDRLPQLEQNVQLFKELGINTLYICSSLMVNMTSTTKAYRFY